MMGTILWTAFVYLTGNFATLLPGVTGVNQANLNWMYTHNAVGLIFTPAGLAIAYYFIPRASNTPLFSHKLSMVGFWSLAFVYVWTGAHHMLHGPISQWLQTISIVFSVMLLIPVWAVVYNFIATMKGQWHQLRDNVPLKFLMSGTVFYLLTCFQGPMHSLRSVNAIVSKTDWIPGHAHMAVLGTFSFFAMAGVYYVIPRVFKTKLHSDALANWSFWLFMIGGLGMFTSLWLGGFWQGWQWNNPKIPFIDTVVALKPVWTGAILLRNPDLLGIVLFLYNIMATALGSGKAKAEPRARVGEGRSYAAVKPIPMQLFVDCRPGPVLHRRAAHHRGSALIDKSWGKPFENTTPPRGRPASWWITPSRKSAVTPSTFAKAASIATRSRRARWLRT
jgi:cytochrome c oxidase cbb3-type subunit 1